MINTREDLNNIVGTEEYDNFIKLLEGSIFKLEKNDVNKTWILVEDLSTIEKFEFSKEDFRNISPPPIPEYISDFPNTVPQILSEVRSSREIVLNRLAGIALFALASDDSATVNACAVARNSLLDITTLPSVVNSSDYLSLKINLKTAYLEIKESVPENVRTAFREFNL